MTLPAPKTLMLDRSVGRTMDGVDIPSAEDIARRAQELKIVVLAQQLSLTAIMHPELPLLRVTQHVTGVSPESDVPLDLPGGPGEDVLRLSVRQILTAASALRGMTLGDDLMSMAMITAATRLGDMIVGGGHCRQDVPLLQFARHLRNAAAHGNRWHFKQGQPEHVAKCRHLTLTSGLHGQRALWGNGAVTPQLFVLFLDDVANYFVPGFAPQPVRATTM